MARINYWTEYGLYQLTLRGDRCVNPMVGSLRVSLSSESDALLFITDVQYDLDLIFKNYFK